MSWGGRHGRLPAPARFCRGGLWPDAEDFRSCEHRFYYGGVSWYAPKRPAPISHPPEHWDGWSGHWPGLRRVIAIVHWTDGTTTEHRTHAQQWTSDRVRVIIETDHDPPRRSADLWLPASDVRRNNDPPELGETIPAPEYGPTYIKEATQRDIDRWQRKTPPTST